MADRDDELVGYQAAADYLGLKRNTLSSYCSERTNRSTGERQAPTGPRVKDRRVVGTRVLPVFDRAELDRWKRSRPGQGRRTDLATADN